MYDVNIYRSDIYGNAGTDKPTLRAVVYPLIDGGDAGWIGTDTDTPVLAIDLSLPEGVRIEDEPDDLFYQYDDPAMPEWAYNQIIAALDALDTKGKVQ